MFLILAALTEVTTLLVFEVALPLTLYRSARSSIFLSLLSLMVPFCITSHLLSFVSIDTLLDPTLILAATMFFWFILDSSDLVCFSVNAATSFFVEELASMFAHLSLGLFSSASLSFSSKLRTSFSYFLDVSLLFTMFHVDMYSFLESLDNVFKLLAYDA